MLAEQRYQKIISLMQTDGSVKVADLKRRWGFLLKRSAGIWRIWRPRG